MKEKEEFSRTDPDAHYKVFWLTVLNWVVPIICVLTGLFITTQKFAPLMNYDPRVIGRPLFILKNGYRIYNPLVFILGMFKYSFNDVYSFYFFQAVPAAFFGLSLGALIFVVTSIIVSGHQKNQHIHGTARWATVKDLQKYGMLQQHGVVCGELENANVGYHLKEEDMSLVLDLHKSIFGKPQNAPLICHSGRTNTWMIAPTRSGKGVSTVIPTCINYGVPYYHYDVNKNAFFVKHFDGKLKFLAHKKKVIKGRGSMVIFDPKGENWAATAGWRSKFSTCVPFRPLGDRPISEEDKNDPKWKKVEPEWTAHYNPLAEIPDNPNTAFAWADMIAEIFFSNEKKGNGGGGDETSAYFSSKARDIFTAVVLHVRFSPENVIPWKEKNMVKVLEFMSEASHEGKTGKEASDEENEGCGEAMCNTMIATDHGSEIINNLIRLAANRSLLQPAKERGSTYSTVFSKITLFQDPLVAEATSYSDFSVDDFINSVNGISLYLIIPYNHIPRIAPVFRMLITFMIKKFSDGTTSANSVKLKNPCLFLLDEFPVLGYFPDIAQNMGILAGYGVTFFIVSQSVNQLVETYGEKHPFLDHCKTLIIYAPGNYQDAKNFSETIGNRSVLLDNISSSGSKYQVGYSNISRSSQETATSLINPDELMKLEFNRCIVINQGMAPYKGKKVVYYEDPRFMKLAWQRIPDWNYLTTSFNRLPSHQKIRKQISSIDKAIEKINAVKADVVIPAEYDLFAAS
ncbi:MAG: type IV secretory system conjugative DNA transfer family protein [Treponema sp.]|nr:type IV secretory system conjugative DNA transfer family protein [Treponema sp.]